MGNQISGEIVFEIRLLGEAFLLGVCLMVLYDGLRLLRVFMKHSSILVNVQDLLFWAVAALSICYLLFLENSGKVRFYAIAGTSLGMILYYSLWGRYWQRWLRKIILFVKKSWFFRKKG